MKRKWIVIACCILGLTACAPSESAVNTAIAQTQEAKPTATLLPTELPTDTPVPSVTPTITVSPSPTPDLRIIQIEPKGFLLQKGELPQAGKYFLPGPDWISPSHNQEVIAARTVEEGRKYLEETGRIDGWYVTYKRGTSGVNMPEEVYNLVIEFETAQGAQVLINKYLTKDTTEDGFTELENPPQIGDVTRMFIKRGDNNRVEFFIAFTYLNYYNEIRIWGWESEIDQKLAQELSELQLRKFKEALLILP